MFSHAPIITAMMKIDRRAMIAASGATLFLPGSALAQGRERFSWEMVIARAQRLARQPYRETPHHPGARKVDYDALYKARFREDRTIWGNLPGDTGVQLFPLSASAEQPVEIELVENGRAVPLRYDPTMFDAPADNAVQQLGPDAGYAGFRVMNAARNGDWLSFLGASYFRSPARPSSSACPPVRSPSTPASRARRNSLASPISGWSVPGVAASPSMPCSTAPPSREPIAS